MQYHMRIFSIGLIICMATSLLCISDVKADLSTHLTDLSDLSKYECVGSLTENFDELSDINALYRKSGADVLSGTWQRSARGTGGSAAVENSGLCVKALGGDWNTFSGVDFVFDKPITSNYFLEVSYEITGITENSAGAVFFNNLSDSSSAIHNVNSVGAGLWENNGFQFLKSNEEYKPVFAECWTKHEHNVTASVKTVYNLNNWTYDGMVTIGSETKQVTSLPIAPAGYDDNGGTFVCAKGSSFDRVTVAVRNGISKIDNISIKAYKTKYNLIENMNFDGCKSIEDVKKLGFLTKDNTISVGSAFKNDEMSPSMCINNAPYGVNLPVLDTAAYDGAYRISYWVYSSSAQASFVVDVPMVINSFENGSLLLLKIHNNKVFSDDLYMTDLEENAWYRFEHVIDLDKRIVSAAAYKADGSMAGISVRRGFTNFTEGEPDDKINHFSGIRFRNWSNADVYVDNIDVCRAEGNLINAYAKVDFNNPEHNTGMTQIAVTNKEVERAGKKGMLMDRNGGAGWDTFSGVDFVFDRPITPEYVIEVSYEVTSLTDEAAGAVFFNNISNPNEEFYNMNCMGAGLWENNGFQFIKANKDNKGTNAWCWIGHGRNYTAAVKTVYDLNKWKYDGTVTIDSETKQVTALPIAPAAYDGNGGTFVCTPQSTFDRITFAVRNGSAKIDNVSVKAYRTEADCVGMLSESFDGLTNINALYRKSGEGVLSGTWQQNVRQTGGNAAIEDGAMCIMVPESGMYMHFDVDDTMMYDIPNETPIEVTVEYFDEGNGYFELAYDGYGALPGRNDIWVNTECVRMTDSKEWKTHTFYAENMRMTNRADNADFRLGVYSLKDGRSPGSVVIGSVTMQTSEYHDPLRLLSVTGNKPGNIYSKGEEIGIDLNFENKSAREARGRFSYTVKSEDGRKIGGEENVSCIFPERKKTTLSLKPPIVDKYGIYYMTIEGTFEYTDGQDTETVPFSADIEYSLSWEVSKEDINDKYGTALLICEHEWSAKDGVAAGIAGRAGIGWNREEVRWSRTELVPGVYKIPDNMRRELEYAKEAGMKIELGLLYSNPDCYDSFADMMDPPTTDEELEAYGNWCEWLASETKGLVYAFAVWNEYTLDSFNSTNDSTENYVKIMETAYKAVKKGNPDALVIGCDGIGSTDITFFEQVFTAGGLNYMDVLGLHPYDWSGHFDTQKPVKECNQLKELMRKYGDEKPIWWTEFGFGARYTLEEQRNNLIMAYAIQECCDVADATYQFRFQDDLRIGEDEAKWGLLWSYEDLGRENGAKPSYLGICAMNNLIGANAEARDVICGGTTYAFRFYNKKMGKDIVLLEGEYDANYMKIKLGTKKLEVYDVYGNKLEPVESEDGVYGFVINREPVYVAGNFTAFEQIGEIEDVTSGIVKNDKIVNQLSETLPGDEVNVKMHKKLFSEDKQEGYCVLAFYDEDENLLQSVWDNISFTNGNNYWSGCAAQVPENAAFAQVFTWEYDTLIPLRKRIMIKS